VWTRAAWDFAIERGLPYGGFVPRGRGDENGLIPSIYAGLSEAPSEDPAVRTTLNVCCYDATVVICRGQPAGGAALTIEFARVVSRPLLLIDLAQRTPGAAADARRCASSHQL
jgi:hypothetical protein